MADVLRDLGDVILDWTRPLEPGERLAVIRQIWVAGAEPLLRGRCDYTDWRVSLSEEEIRGLYASGRDYRMYADESLMLAESNIAAAAEVLPDEADT